MPDLSRLVIAVESNGVVTAVKSLEELAQAGSKSEKSVGGLMEKFQAMQSIMQGPIAAFQATKQVIGSMVDVGGEMIDQYMEGARAMVQVEQIIKTTGGAAGVSVGQIDELANSLSKLTGIDDDKIDQMSAVMLTFKNVGSGIFDSAIESAADMSTVMGTDLVSATTMLGKALNDPLEGMSALGRIGVQLTDQQKKQIEGFMKVNDLASAQGVIMKELKTEFGGTARAVGEQLGALDKLQVAWGNLMGSMGESIYSTLKPIAEWLAKIFDDMSKISGTATVVDAKDQLIREMKGVSANDTIGLNKIKAQVAGITDEMILAAQKTGSFEQALEQAARRAQLLDEVTSKQSELGNLGGHSNYISDRFQNFSEAAANAKLMYASKAKEYYDALKKTFRDVMEREGFDETYIQGQMKAMVASIGAGANEGDRLKKGYSFVKQWENSINGDVDTAKTNIKKQIDDLNKQLNELGSGSKITKSDKAIPESLKAWQIAFQETTGVVLSASDTGSSALTKFTTAFQAFTSQQDALGTALGEDNAGALAGLTKLRDVVTKLAASKEFNIANAVAGDGTETALSGIITLLDQAIAAKEKLAKADWLTKTLDAYKQEGAEIGKTKAQLVEMYMVSKKYSPEQIKQVLDQIAANEKLEKSIENQKTVEDAIASLRESNAQAQAELAGQEYDATDALISKLESQLDLNTEEGQKLQDLIKLYRQLKDEKDKIAAQTKDKENLVELNKIVKGLGDQIIQKGLSDLVDNLQDMGKALAQGANAGDAFGDALQSTLASLVQAMPQMMLSAGIQLCSAGQFGPGLALIAASGIMSLAVGYVTGAAEADSASSSTSDSVSSGSSVTTRSVRSSIQASAHTDRSSSRAGDVTLQLIDQNNSRVETSTSTGPNGEKLIKTLILSAVSEHAARGGLDSILGSRYGLTARGR